MSVFARVHMPTLDGATEWLNSEPLGPAELLCSVLRGAGLLLWTNPDSGTTIVGLRAAAAALRDTRHPSIDGLSQTWSYSLGSSAIASIEMSRPWGSRTWAGAERAGAGSGMWRA